MGAEYPDSDDQRSSQVATDLPEPSGPLGRTVGERLLTRLAPWFYPVYLLIFNDRQDTIREIEGKLSAANIPLSAEVVVSGSIGFGVLLGFPLAALLAFVAYPLPDISLSSVPAPLSGLVDVWKLIELPLELPLVIMVALAIGFSIGLVSVYYGGKLLLRTRISSRERNINLILADAIAFLHAQSDGGMGPLELIESMADSEATYGEIAVEFRRIKRRIDYFGESYQTAIEEIASSTPSEELEEFLNDMLSVINSGGDMTYFLNQQRNQRLSALEQAQNSRLDVIEMLGQFHLTGSMLPLFIIIILVIQSLLGSPQPLVLVGTVYFLIPGVSLLFITAISTLKHDDPGSGKLSIDGEEIESHHEFSLFDLGVVDRFVDTYDDAVFVQARRQEIKNRVGRFLSNPLAVFRERPHMTLYVTVPLALLVLVGLYATGSIGPSITNLQESGVDAIVSSWEGNPIWQTLGWALIPSYIVLIPLGYYYERQMREREGITETLTQELRKISNHNDSGLTILESIRMTGDASQSQLGEELRIVHKKVEYGQSLSRALVEMNNKYAQPRLARMVQLVERAQRSSNQISDILRSATKLSETRDALDSEYRTRMQRQLMVLGVTFFVFLGILAFLRVFFLPTMAELIGSGDASERLIGASANLSFTNLIFFHGALLQGIMTGVLLGYVRHHDFYRSIKWIVGFSSVTVLAWWIATLIG